MKTKFYLTLMIALTVTTVAQAARSLNQAKTDGANWSSASAWSLNRTPASNDSIVIPAGITIWVNIRSTLNNVYVNIAGTVEVDKNSGLTLDNTSIISIATGGLLSTTHNSSTSVISIGGVNKYVGNTDISIPGFAMASSATGASPVGFQTTPITLPVTWVSFTAVRNGGTVSLNWITANEKNNSHFEVERSTNGSDWNTLATVAAGETDTQDSYTYTDETATATQTLYRVRQIDEDGQYSYSKIVTVDGTETISKTTAKTTIFAAGKTINIRFDEPVSNKITVRLVSMGGQVLQQQAVEAASGATTLAASNLPAGIYVVYVTDGKSWSAAQKVML
jgi:type IX secretion system substrate protein/G8 domain-containing protein